MKAVDRGGSNSLPRNTNAVIAARKDIILELVNSDQEKAFNTKRFYTSITYMDCGFSRIDRGCQIWLD